MPGALAGLRVIELANQVPSAFAGLLLSDLGADVIRVDRPGGSSDETIDPGSNLMNRGKRSVMLDLKNPAGADVLLRLVARADVMIEGFRPGVAERLGVGPEHCRARNEQLVYARMTGWGQTGPYAQAPGHDITYIAATGALHAIGSAGGPPQIPLTLLGNFAGGAAYLVIGVLAALRSAHQTGRGQVIDAAQIDGVTHLLAPIHSMLNSGAWEDRRGVNLVDGGAPFYGVYETADGRYMAVGAVEERFYLELLAGLGIDEPACAQYDATHWPELRAQLAAAFLTRSQAQWSEIFGRRACVSPVLSLREAADHPQLKHRDTLTLRDGAISPGVAPRLSDAEDGPGKPMAALGADTREVLAEWEIDSAYLPAGGDAGVADEADPAGQRPLSTRFTAR
jgi:alpha-methylacyl-CoA racemase